MNDDLWNQGLQLRDYGSVVADKCYEIGAPLGGVAEMIGCAVSTITGAQPYNIDEDKLPKLAELLGYSEQHLWDKLMGADTCLIPRWQYRVNRQNTLEGNMFCAAACSDVPDIPDACPATCQTWAASYSCDWAVRAHCPCAMPVTGQRKAAFLRWAERHVHLWQLAVDKARERGYHSL